MYGKTVLIADDEENIRRLVRNMLGEQYIVLEAQDGEVAVDTARNQKPDLILMDLTMPKMDGYTACFSIKTDPATKEIPVVILTGISHEFNKKFAREMGADGYITKPFSADELLRQVKQVLGE